MQNDVGGHAETSPPPCTRQREMDLTRQHIRQPVQRERRLVRHDPGALRPQPRRDQFFVITRREVNEPIDAATHTNRTSGVDVVHKQLRRVTRVGRLLGREQPRLRRSGLKKTVPIWAG